LAFNLLCIADRLLFFRTNLKFIDSDYQERTLFFSSVLLIFFGYGHEFDRSLPDHPEFCLIFFRHLSAGDQISFFAAHTIATWCEHIIVIFLNKDA
jgi:hypothetical protein